MSRLDERTQSLKLFTGVIHLTLNSNSITSNLSSILSSNASNEKSDDKTLENLQACIELFETIKMMCSNDRVPVILVYRERRARKQHRHEEKGQSNKVKFPKEKRDFLELMGVPGQMVTTQGFDYSVKPGSICLEEEKKPQSVYGSGYDEKIEAFLAKQSQPDDKEKGDEKIKEKEKEKEKEPQINPSMGEATELLNDSEDKKITMVARTMSQQLIGMRNKHAVSPYPENKVSDNEKSSNRPKAAKKSKSKKKKKKNKDKSKTKEDDHHSELRSILSCDTCSSNESEAESEEEEVELLISDEADAVKFTEDTIHKETVLPPPLQEDGGTYLTFAMEKIGVKDTYKLSCPFLRMSLRGMVINIKYFV